MVQGLPWILIWKNWPNIRFSNRAGLALSYHNLRVGGSNPAPATNFFTYLQLTSRLAFEAAFLRFSVKPIRQLGAFVALP